MDLLKKTQELCQQYNIKPQRSKGQNFLINEEVYDKIVAAAELKKTDTVLEVGPGFGFLTAKLAAKAGQVIAVELDDKLAAYLKDVFAASNVAGNVVGNVATNVDIINENILDIPNSKFQIPDSNFKIVANLPYNITSVFLRKFLPAENKPSEMILMLQKEVAERICASAGDMSLLALSVQFYAEPKILFNVPRADFYPAPEVDSAVIQIRNKKEEIRNEKEFFRLAKIGFSAKRKMLKNNLANGLHISNKEAEEILVKNGFDSKIRAEDLSVEDWIKLLKESKL